MGKSWKDIVSQGCFYVNRVHLEILIKATYLDHKKEELIKQFNALDNSILELSLYMEVDNARQELRKIKEFCLKKIGSEIDEVSLEAERILETLNNFEEEE